jgi:non-canonical (house-cleaning) NTP pyrophosphatase
MLAALKASQAYHKLLGSLEAAHIRHDTQQPFRIQRRLAKALARRDEAIQALNEHEHAHALEAAG